MRLRSISMPGTLRGCEPVATMISFLTRRASACRPSVTSTLPLPASRPAPLIQSILFFLNRNSMPPVRPLTILSLRAWTWFMSMPMAACAEREAPLLPVLRDLQRVRVLEQRLGRNAAPVEAGAAEHRRALDDRGLQAELRGADRGDVAAGAGADHDDVVFVRHIRCSLSSSSTTSGTKATVRRRLRRRRGSRGLFGFGIEAGHLRPQPRVVVAQLPVGLVQRFELPRRARAGAVPRRRQASEQRHDRDSPQRA